MNPDDQRAQDRFIKVTKAYEALVEVFQPDDEVEEQDLPADEASVEKDEPSPVQTNPGLSEHDQKLKQDSYRQLQMLLKQQKYPRAIALVEGLAQRITKDTEVRQWQAITYQRWGARVNQSGTVGQSTYLSR